MVVSTMISKNIPAAQPQSNGYGMRIPEAHEIKLAGKGREVEILNVVAGIPMGNLDGRHHGCHVCLGSNRARLIDAQAGAYFCNQCFNSKNGDFIAAVQHFQNTDFLGARKLIADHLGMLTPYSPAQPDNPITVDAVGHLATIKNCPKESLIAYGARNEVHQQGSSSELKVTFPVYGPDCQPCSTFSIWPYSTNKKRLKGMLAKGKPAGVFLPHNADGTPRFPQPGETWLIVEGVKDAAALHAKGFLVVGINGEKLSPKFVALFRGCNVIIVPDRTTSAEEKANESAARMAGFAQSVRVAVLPLPLDGSKGDDTRDALKQPNGEELVKNAIEGAPEWKPLPKKNKEEGDEPSHLQLAQAFLGSLSVGGVCRFCLHGGDLYEWRGDHYQRSHNKGMQDIRNLLWVWLDMMGCGPTKNLVGSVLDGVIPLISSARDTPAESTIFWRGNPSSNFPSGADLNLCIPTKSGLIVPYGSHYASQWPSIPRDASLFVRDCMPFDFARDANGLIDCPQPERWLTFLDEIFGGEVDQVDALQLWFGYCLTQDSSQQKILFLTGPSRSGKGKLATILQHIVGRHMSVGTSLYVLAGRFGIGSLLGKRVAIFSDERRLSPAIYSEVLPRLLAISGQDTVTIDRKNRDEIAARLGCRLMILSNEMSPILDEGQALTARTILLRTRRTWAGNEDFNLERDLLAELPGILKWSLDGMARILMGQRLTSPYSTADELDSIRDDANPLADFLQFIVDDSEGWIGQDDLLKAIRTWARQTDNLPMQGITKKRVTMLLTSARPHVKVTQKRCSDSPGNCDTDNRKRGYSGIRIDTHKACMADLLF